MNKIALTCIDWQPMVGGTLIGRASIRFDAFGLIVHDVEVHRSPRLWVKGPAAAVVIDDEPIRDRRGEIRLRPACSFGAEAAEAILVAIEAYDPAAFIDFDG